MRIQLSKLMKKNRFINFVIGYLVTLALLLITFYALQPLYYKVMPGSWWIQYNATVEPGRIGEPVTLHLERTQKIDIIKFTGVRTVIEDNLDLRREFPVPDPERGLEFANAEGRDGDIDVEINTDKMPQVPGVYHIQTCIEFTVSGQPKSTCYNSNEFSYD